MTDHLKASPPERYEEISRHLLDQAQEELDKGDILQASDKVWGATAHAIKAVCQQMGWNHHAHNHLRAAANYIASEFGRDDLVSAYGYLDALHTNYYEHQLLAAEVRVGINNAAFFIRESWLPSRSANFLLIVPTCRPWSVRIKNDACGCSSARISIPTEPQFSPEEVEALPPVKPAPPVSTDE